MKADLFIAIYEAVGWTCFVNRQSFDYVLLPPEGGGDMLCFNVYAGKVDEICHYIKDEPYEYGDNAGGVMLETVCRSEEVGDLLVIVFPCSDTENLCVHVSSECYGTVVLVPWTVPLALAALAGEVGVLLDYLEDTQGLVSQVIAKTAQWEKEHAVQDGSERGR
jgi:hypothetical protein